MKMDMNKMISQVQEMQEQMAKAQEELASETVEASAGGGMVRVKATGAGESSRSRSRPRRSTPTIPRCSRTWCSQRSTRRCETRRS